MPQGGSATTQLHSGHVCTKGTSPFKGSEELSEDNLSVVPFCRFKDIRIPATIRINSAISLSRLSSGCVSTLSDGVSSSVSEDSDENSQHVV
jgi:hypothetical protein